VVEFVGDVVDAVVGVPAYGVAGGAAAGDVVGAVECLDAAVAAEEDPEVRDGDVDEDGLVRL